VSGLAIGLGLALLASVALNGAFLLQHAGVASAPPVSPRHPLATIRGLLASRVWALGLALGLGGWALHIGALARAPLSLVQAFVAGGLALTVPAAGRWLHEPLRRREAVAVGAMAAGLALLALGAHADRSTGSLDSRALALYLAAAAALAGCLALAPAGARRAEMLGLAGGVLYGAADGAIKALTGVGIASPWLAVAAVATAGAFFAFQRGLQLGRAVPVIALMTAGTYLVSIVAGVAVLGDPLGHGALLVLHAAALCAVVAAAAVLAPSQARLTEGTPLVGVERG
jgi:drug/metabolite transporter (DMT)-like permease